MESDVRSEAGLFRIKEYGRWEPTYSGDEGYTHLGKAKGHIRPVYSDI